MSQYHDFRRPHWIAGIIVALGSPALASPTVEDEVHAGADTQQSWRAGVRVGASSGLLSDGAIGGLAGSPWIGAGLERRLDSNWWLTTDLTAGWSRLEAPGSEASTWNLAGSIGARHVFNPADLVDFALGLRVGFGGGRSELCEEDDGCQTTSLVSASLAFDVSVALALTESLELRLTATVLEARWSRAEPSGGDATTSVSVGATVRPGLGLFLSF